MEITEAKEWIVKTCGEGWMPLVEEAYEKLPSTISISCVYQKWGVLKFDCEPWDEGFESFLEDIEERSMGICEKCGGAGAEKIIDGWVHTRCDLHD